MSKLLIKIFVLRCTYSAVMTPNPEKDIYQSSLGFKGIQNREKPFKNADLWLEDKQALDGAEGLWRVHDNLYDVSNFIDTHPGGQFWLETTKGTDITEAFESHHISTKPEVTLQQYFVREANTKRNSPFTFHDDGFYRTLKRNVREALKGLPKGVEATSNIIVDVLFILAFVLAVLSCSVWSYTLAVISGIFLSSGAMAAHNYYHKKKNFRMYYSDLAMVSSREWRILHVLSHHMFTNTILDMQAYLSEPILQYFPHAKSKFTKFGSWLYAPAIIWPILFHFMFAVRIYQGWFGGQNKSINKADLLPLLLPLTMYFIGGQSLPATIGMWSFTLAVHSFWFCFMALATTHFHPDIFMDGDKPRFKDEMDWGIIQLDTVGDRYEVTGSHFLVLVSLGDHALHHLFPTFDHGILQHLYPVVEKTMKEFNLNIRMTSQTDMVLGYFRQLVKERPNQNPQNLFNTNN